MNLIDQLDYALFTLINQWAGRWPWLDTTARLFLNDYFVPTVLAITLLALWFEGNLATERSRNQQAVVLGALSAVLANSLVKTTNLLYDRARPFETYDVNMLFYRPTDPSLPSNAAALGFSVAVGVWLYRPRWGGWLLGLATIFGLSRIFGGVHYPLDVAIGALLGGGSAWILFRQPHLINRVRLLTVKSIKRLKLE